MKAKWISRLASINKELLLVLSIIAAAAAVNFLVAGQRLVLSFYNLPTLLAAYYFGRRHAVAAAVASVLFVVWMNLMNPMVLGVSMETGPAPVDVVGPGHLGWLSIDFRLCDRNPL